MTRFLFAFILFSAPAFAGQEPTLRDSVTVEGRILNLTPRLYRQSPEVIISRNNVLQASRELARPAPLAPDGTFRVRLPILFAQEEFYLNFASISTPFLAAPGTVRILINADSLFVAEVPFGFEGVNARVNQQFARYQAFEAEQPKPDAQKLSRQVARLTPEAAFQKLRDAYNAPLTAFVSREVLLPLTARWIEQVNRQNAVSFLYDMAAAEGQTIPVALRDSLRPPADRLLTAARAVALDRFANYTLERLTANESTATLSGRNSGLSIKALSDLLLRYGRNLTADEQTRLNGFADGGTARTADLRFFEQLFQRNSDTLRRLANYEKLIGQVRKQNDSVTVDYLTAFWLARSLHTLTLDQTRLLYGYVRPKITDSLTAFSLDELYGQAVRDSARIRQAGQQLLDKGVLQSREIAPGIFVTRDDNVNPNILLNRMLTNNRSRVLCAVLWETGDDAAEQTARRVQQVRDEFAVRDLTLLYISPVGDNALLWGETVARLNLQGEHLALTAEEFVMLVLRLRVADVPTVLLTDPPGILGKKAISIDELSAEVRKRIR